MSTNNDIKNYSAEDIGRYWQGKLTSEEMHAMERAAMDDPFLADAMEGYSTANMQQVPADLQDLRERLQQRSSDKKVVPMGRKWWRVAAVVILLGGASLLTLQLLNRNKTNENLVQVNKQEAQSPLADSTVRLKDSIGATYDFNTTADSLMPANQFSTTQSAGSNASAGVAAPPKKTETFLSSSLKKDAPAVPDLSAYKKTDSDGSAGNVVNHETRGDTGLIAANDAAKTERESKLQESAAVYRNNVPANQSNQANQAPASRDNRAFYLNNFSGRVIDADNNAIPQASLRVNNNNMLATTDNNGYFNIRSGDSLLDLSVVSSGYQSRQLQLRSNQPSDVVLDPVPQKKAAKESDDADLKKVSSPKAKTDAKTWKVYTMEAEPVIGWDEYKNYLVNNNRLVLNSPTNIEVIVSFAVSKNGRLSSFNIEKSAGKAYDAEAIRLVKAGPDWKVTKDRKTRARVIVTF